MPLNDHITLSLCGDGAGSLTDDLDAAGIGYTTFERKPGKMYAAAGDILQLMHDAVPYATLASILIAWIRARASREIMVTTKDYKVVHAKGMSVEDFEQLLRITNRISAIDPTKLESDDSKPIDSPKPPRIKGPRRSR